MPIGTPTTPPVKVGGATAASFNTGAWTPPTNCTLLCVGSARGSSSTMPTIADTGGTWVAVTPNGEATTSGYKGKLWKMEIGAVAPTLNTTITSTGATQTTILVQDWPGASVHATNVQMDTDTAGKPAVVMNAFQAGSAAWGFYASSGGAAVTPPTGYTEAYDALPATNCRVSSVYDLASPGTAIGWPAGTGASAIAFGVEMIETVVAGGTTGTLETTEVGSDVAAIEGTVRIAGDLASAEQGSDVAALSGTVRVVGTLSSTETGGDTFTGAGSPRIVGVFDATEVGSDVAVIRGPASGPITGTLETTEVGQDTVAISGTARTFGDLAAVEVGQDSAAFAGFPVVAGTMATVEAGSDSFSGTGTPIVRGVLAAVEIGSDTAQIIGGGISPIPIPLAGVADFEVTLPGSAVITIALASTAVRRVILLTGSI